MPNKTMDRILFTRKITNLLAAMFLDNETPIIDFVKRSDEEQARLYRIGRDINGEKIGTTVTDCDGKKRRSKHQSGRAMDIYFVDKGELVDPIKGWAYWHDKWEEMGGQPAIDWDMAHFEG